MTVKAHTARLLASKCALAGYRIVHTKVKVNAMQNPQMLSPQCLISDGLLPFNHITSHHII